MFCFFLLALVASTLAQGNPLDSAVGPCINGQCPPGHSCMTMYDQCIPSPSPSKGVGPCINGVHCPGSTYCVKGECFMM